MTLETLGPLAFALGLIGLAGLLYALQRLRVRHRELVVVTTLFWREALHESRARTLVERFRHPLAYLLVLLVAGLLWLAFAGIDSRRVRGTQHTLFLDASAAAALPGRFDAALAALESELARCPRDRTEVVWCGARVHSLLSPGEDRALLGARLAGLAPEAAPPSLERAMLEHAGRAEPGELERFVVVGDSPIGADAAARIERGGARRLERAPLAPPGERGRGITALGIAPAASGAWSRVDALVEVRGEGAGAAELVATLDGEPLAGESSEGSHGSAAARTALAADHARWTFSGLPARGGRLEVRIAGAGATGADDVAALRLPERPPIRVWLAPDLAARLSPAGSAALRDALAADPSLALVATAGEARVHVAAKASGATPCLELVAAAEQADSIRIGHDAGRDSAAALAEAVGELGLDRVDGAALASELGVTIAAGASPLAPGEARRVSVWSELLDPELTSFTESRAFPLFVGRSLRWLAEVEPLVPYVAAGRAIPHRLADAPPPPRVPASAALEGGSDTAPVSLLEPARYAHAGFAPAAEPAPSSPEGAGRWRPATWILLSALALLVADWVLYRRGRVP